jgi:hypothetical protein
MNFSATMGMDTPHQTKAYAPQATMLLTIHFKLHSPGQQKNNAARKFLEEATIR